MSSFLDQVKVAVSYSNNLPLLFSESLFDKHNSSNEHKFENLHPITYKNLNAYTKTPNSKAIEIHKQTNKQISKNS